MNAQYNLKLDSLRKTIFATVEGNFGPEDCNGFVLEYSKIVSSINPKEYELRFDCTKLKVTAVNTVIGVDMTTMLQGCIEMYKKDDFKRIVCDCTENVIMAMQVKRLSNNTGLTNLDIIK